MKVRKCKRLLYIGILIAAMVLPGCTRSPGESPDSNGKQTEQGEAPLIESDELYVLLCVNTEKTSIFLENVVTGKQGEFQYDNDTSVKSRDKADIAADQLQYGELLRISYLEEESLTVKNRLTKVEVSSDTFELADIIGFTIDPEAKTILVEDARYYYDEALTVFSDAGTIPISEVSSLDMICIRGQEERILTLVVTASHDPKE